MIFSLLSPLFTVRLTSFFFFFLMIRRPPRSTLFPTRRSSDLNAPDNIDPEIDLLHLLEVQRHIPFGVPQRPRIGGDRKSTRLNSSHLGISYAVFCLKKKKENWQNRF